MSKFRPRPLFPKRQLPSGFRMPKPCEARPSKPIKGAPPLPLTTADEEEARRYFAKAKLQDMRRAIEEDNR